MYNDRVIKTEYQFWGIKPAISNACLMDDARPL